MLLMQYNASHYIFEIAPFVRHLIEKFSFWCPIDHSFAMIG